MVGRIFHPAHRKDQIGQGGGRRVADGHGGAGACHGEHAEELAERVWIELGDAHSPLVRLLEPVCGIWRGENVK